MDKNLKERVDQLPRRPGTVSPTTATETDPNSVGSESRIMRLRADTATKLQTGRQNPFAISVPSYEKLGTTDGTADNTETFNLSSSLAKSPNTEDVVVWLGESYYGNPDAIDYANDTIDVTDSGTNSNVHAYYLVDEPATLTVEKATPGGGTEEPLYSSNLKLTHQTNQHEDPEYLSLTESVEQGFVAGDMTLDFYIDAPYPIQWSDDDGDGTEPTNALLNLPIQIGQDTVAGLQAAIRQDMAQRTR